VFCSLGRFYFILKVPRGLCNPILFNSFLFSLKGTLAWDFFVPFFCTYQTYIGQIIRLLRVFDFVLEFADLFVFFNIWRWLSWRRVSFPVNWVNAKWDSMSTESSQSETPRQLSQRRMMISSWMLVTSALTQLTWSLILRWLSWCGVSLRVNSVARESHSTLTQCAEEKLNQNRHTYPALAPLKG
jgi:hypothetical protein